VLVALAIGALGTVLFSRREIRAQER